MDSPDLPPPARAAANTLAAFLARRDATSLSSLPPCDAIVVCGSAVLATVSAAVEALTLGLAPRILFSGGVGHSTPLLYAAAAAIAPPTAFPDARSEAAVLRDVALAFGAPSGALLVEEASKNCGSNASMSRDALAAAGLPLPAALLLIQDPTMQRRTHASFEKVFAGTATRLLSWAPFVPRVGEGSGSGKLLLEPEGAWSDARYLELLLGEVPRLRNAHGGYGPRGAGFIAAVEVPPEVEEAQEAVAAALRGGSGGGREAVGGGQAFARAVAPVGGKSA